MQSLKVDEVGSRDDCDRENVSGMNNRAAAAEKNADRIDNELSVTELFLLFRLASLH